MKNYQVEKVYSKQQIQKEIFDSETLKNLSKYDVEIENYNYVSEFEDVRACIVVDLAGELFRREGINDGRLHDEVVVLFSDKNGKHLAVEQKYKYDDAKNKVAIILVADNCYVAHYSDEPIKDTQIKFDEQLTTIWRDILSILYEDYNPDLKK